MAITNKALHVQLTNLCDIFARRMGKLDWRNYDCCWLKRHNEKDKEDVLVLVVRGDTIRRTERALSYICGVSDVVPKESITNNERCDNYGYKI